MPGQNFQEENAAFEHMYAPSRAKALFKRHRDIKEKYDRDMARMTWETKTTINEIQKGKSMFERRGDTLYKKVREIEDREFSQLHDAYNKGMNDGYNDDEPLDLVVPPMRQRTGAKSVKIRPCTTQNISEEHNRSRSDLGSKEGSRPNSGTKPRPHTSVHFAIPADEEEKENGNESVAIDGPPYLARKSSLLDRRARRKSVFARTKAKQFELRNERFKEENYELQIDLNEKIQDFYVRLEEYKEEYRKSLDPKSKELPEITSKDVTSMDDVSGEKYTKDNFQPKLVNPFGNRAKYMDVDKVENKFASKSHDSIKSILSNKSSNINLPVDNKHDAGLGKSKEAEVSKSSMVSKSTSVLSDRPSSLTRQTVRRTLSIMSRPYLEDREEPSREQMMKERVKLLYLDAHGELEEIKQPAPVKPKPKKITRRKSEFDADTAVIEDAFDEFILGRKTQHDMMKLVSVAAKLKHNARKKRDKSFIPFIAARKALQAWKTLASKSKDNINNIDKTEDDSKAVKSWKNFASKSKENIHVEPVT